MVVLLLIGFAVSNNRRLIRPRVVIAALLSQIVIGTFVLFVPIGKDILGGAANAVRHVLDYGNHGIDFLFGGLVSAKMFEVFGDGGFVFAFRVLPAIIFVTALISVLYYMGVMKWLVLILGTIFQKVIGVSKIESFSAATTIFLGQSEMPAVVKPFIKKPERAGTVCGDVQRHGVGGWLDTGRLRRAGREDGLPAGGVVHGHSRWPPVRQNHLSQHGQEHRRIHERRFR